MISRICRNKMSVLERGIEVKEDVYINEGVQQYGLKVIKVVITGVFDPDNKAQNILSDNNEDEFYLAQLDKDNSGIQIKMFCSDFKIKNGNFKAKLTLMEEPEPIHL